MANSENSDEASLPLLNEPRFPFHYIDSANSLEPVISALEQDSGFVAIDAERASGFRYSQRAYLIQIKTSTSDTYLIDPTSEADFVSSDGFQRLKKLLADRTWILHAATQDIPCLSELGLTPAGIFDTELAARIAGEPRVGLGALTESLLGLKLAKEHSAADWSTRPLPESWLRYAALDVDVLHDLATAVSGLLVKQGKEAFAAEEFESLLKFKPKPARDQKWRSISGLSKLKNQQSFEIARQLWEARENLASKLDVAPGRLIPDSAILAAATEKPKSKPELANLKTFSGRASRSYLDTWWSALSSAQKSTDLPALRPERSGEIPNHRNWAAKFPEADKRLRFAKNSLIELSDQLSIPVENLLTPDYLRSLCFLPPEPCSVDSISDRLSELGARNWQRKLCSEVIWKSFSLAEQSQDEQAVPAPPALGAHEAL